MNACAAFALPARARSRIFPLLPLAAIVALLATPTYSSTSQTQQPNVRSKEPAQEEVIASLEMGKSIERELRGGEHHSYGIKAEAGQFIHAVVVQKGVDVAVTLFTPEGKQLAQMDGLNGSFGPEPISTIAESGGIFRLQVAVDDANVPSGRYEITLTDLRMPTDKDRNRIAAERSYMEGMQLWAKGDPESKRAALGKWEQCLPLWKFVGDSYEEALTIYGSASVYNDLGESQKAIDLYNQALPLWRAAGDRTGEAMTLHGLGIVYDALGELQKAFNYYLQALPLWRAAGNYNGAFATHVYIARHRRTLPATAQKPRLVIQTGHTSSIHSIAFSPDGYTLATASYDRTVKLWDAETGVELRAINVPTSHYLAFSPDGRTLAADNASNNIVYTWDVSTGRELGKIIDAERAAFSPDWRALATATKETVTLQDAATGQKIRSLTGLKNLAFIFFSPDGLKFLTAETEGGGGTNLSLDFSSGGMKMSAVPDLKYSVKTWDVTTGRELRAIQLHADLSSSWAYSPDGRWLATAGGDGVTLWNMATGANARTWPRPACSNKGETCYGGKSSLEIAFSPDSRILAYLAGSCEVGLWEISSGRELIHGGGKGGACDALTFSPDGRRLAITGGHEVRIIDLAVARVAQSLNSNATWIGALALSPDGRWIASTGGDDVAKLWDASMAQSLRALSLDYEWGAAPLSFSSDGKLLAAAAGNYSIKLWDVHAATQTKVLKEDCAKPSCAYKSLSFSPDGEWLASTDYRREGGYSFPGKIELWDLAAGKTVWSHNDDATDRVGFSPDGKWIASASFQDIKLWETATGREVHKFEFQERQHGSAGAISFAFSADGQWLVSSALGSSLRIWDVATGHQISSRDDVPATAIAISPDKRWIATGYGGGTIEIWDAANLTVLRTLKGHTDGVNGLAFRSRGQFLVSASSDGTLRIWNSQTGSEVAKAVGLRQNDWAVVDSEGRFDASPGGMQFMHWVVGMEPIALDQLKDRYYEPGLLARILGFNKEPLRDVAAFDKVDLYPEIETEGTVGADGKLHIKLKNRGGGIGAVQIFINGKELLADARGPKPDPNAPEAALTIDVSNAALLHGQENEIRVVARNAEGYLASRGTQITYKAPGAANERKPELYAIVSGVSEYADSKLRLTFSGKDAEDIARALQLGGNRLFGADHVHLTVLSSSGKPGELPPTKPNLKKAFEAAQKAQPGDVLVIYLAGHGVAIHDTYAYPTQEARTLDLSDPAIRELTSVTSEELVEWIKKIPALHQVMILDTCAAGAAAVKLVEKRDVPGDQVRALDRLKDRTGFHVLMGSAADAVSYEASQYGQGLLTYTLLQGMKGAALKNDVDVDVSTLFQYAADKVPDLARGIGGVQKPQIIAPLAGASFDLGQLLAEDKQQIPLAAVKPVILGPRFLNTDEGTDNLGLEVAVRKQLREDTYASARGGRAAAAAIFVDAEEMPGAVRPTGTYTVDGKQVTIKLVLTRDDKKIRLDLQGSADDASALAAKIVAAILQATKSF